MIDRRFVHLVVLAGTLLLGWTQSVSYAQPVGDRLAFIVGNAAYAGSALLKNPINDANAVDAQLRKLGFETSSIKDLKTQDILPLRRQMESRIKRDSVVIFYYAGHGLQVDGRNYLLPVDANLIDPQRTAEESIYLGDILHAIEKTRPKLAIVILDACRDNPFRNNKDFKPLKQGLARVDPPTSTVVFYATRPGGTALDGEGDNGVFTQALLRELSAPDQPLEVILRRVSSSVFKQTKSDQEPWIEGVIREEFIINSGQPFQQASASHAQPDHVSLALLSPTSETSSNNLIALHEAYEKLRSIKFSENETATTLFACDGLNCEDYKGWVKRFASSEIQEKVDRFRQAVTQSKTARVCEFSLEQKNCVTPDLRLPFYGPNLIISNKVYTDGFGIENASKTKSGGLAFDATFLGGAVLYFGNKTKSNCRSSESKIDFDRDRLNLEVARVSCLNNFTVSFLKNRIDVLVLNHVTHELIAEMDISFFGVGFGAVAGGGKKLVKISFS